MSIDRSTLPPNVRRWIDRCVPVQAPIPDQILNTQEGEIDVRGKWMGFTARTSSTTGNPSPFAGERTYESGVECGSSPRTVMMGARDGEEPRCGGCPDGR